MLDTDRDTISRSMKKNEELLIDGKRDERAFNDIYCMWIEEIEASYDNSQADIAAKQAMAARVR